MKNKLWLKIVSLVLVISTVVTALSITTFAEGAESGEIYMNDINYLSR